MDCLDQYAGCAGHLKNAEVAGYTPDPLGFGQTSVGLDPGPCRPAIVAANSPFRLDPQRVLALYHKVDAGSFHCPARLLHLTGQTVAPQQHSPDGVAPNSKRPKYPGA